MAKTNEEKIADIIEFHEQAKLPEPPINIHPSEKIINVKLFVSSHIAVLKNYDMETTMVKASYQRLWKLKKIIEKIK